MTWSQALWAVDANPLPGSIWRQQLQSATLSSQGIINPGDLKVVALGTPGAFVNVSSGAGVVLGQEAPFQGSYYGQNNGVDSVPIASTGGSPRSDLIIARVEDPTVPGTSWSHNPATDQLIYSRVISGVGNTVTSAPSGSSAIALARIDIPVSTSAITNAMIKDVRALVNPLVQRGLSVIPYAGSPDTMFDSRAAYADWPAGSVFNVAVPAWAKFMRVMAFIGQLKVDVNGGSPGGSIRIRVGTLFSQSSFLNSNSGSNYRSTGMVGDVIDVSSLAGTTVTAAIQGVGGGGSGSGDFVIDNQCTLALEWEFVEYPV